MQKQTSVNKCHCQNVSDMLKSDCASSAAASNERFSEIQQAARNRIFFQQPNILMAVLIHSFKIFI